MVVQLVERVEELFLRPLLAGQDLDVVDQQHVRRPVVLLERRHPVRSDAVNHLVHEPLARGVNDPQSWVGIQQPRPMACIRCVFPIPLPP